MGISAMDREIAAGTMYGDGRPVPNPARRVVDHRIFSRIGRVSPDEAFQAGQSLVYRNKAMDKARTIRLEGGLRQVVQMYAQHARDCHRSMLRELGMLPPKVGK